MGASMRRFRSALISLVSIAGPGLAWPAAGWCDEPGPEGQGRREGQGARPRRRAGPRRGRRAGGPEIAAFFSQPGDDPPRLSVPLRPATVEDRRRLEASACTRAARGLEDRGLWTDAVALLQEASKLDPDSVAIARRLSKIYIGALGRPDLAIQYGRRVLAIEPGDTETLSRLVDYYSQARRARGRRDAPQGGPGQSQAPRPFARPARGRIRAGQALLDPAQAARQGRRRLRQGDRRPRRQVGQPPLAGASCIGSSATIRRAPT